MTHFQAKRKTSNIVRSMVRKQYTDIANSAMGLKCMPTVPAEGWIRTIRTALQMSGAQLANRMNISRNRVSILERREEDGDITLNQLREMADKLGCEFTYALVPKTDINTTLENRAEYIARCRMGTNSQNMFLEAQTIDPEKVKFLKEELKQDILKAGGRVLWKRAEGDIE